MVNAADVFDIVKSRKLVLVNINAKTEGDGKIRYGVNFLAFIIIFNEL